MQNLKILAENRSDSRAPRAELLLHKEITAQFKLNSHNEIHTELTDGKQIINAFPDVTQHSSIHKLQAQTPNTLVWGHKRESVTGLGAVPKRCGNINHWMHCQDPLDNAFQFPARRQVNLHRPPISMRNAQSSRVKDSKRNFAVYFWNCFTMKGEKIFLGIRQGGTWTATGNVLS